MNALPLLVRCNPGDVGTECDNPYDTRYRPERLLLYDKHSGGIGLAAQASLQTLLHHDQAWPVAPGLPCILG
jgi:ATP-dependent helicase YprA (DUF1998 family)